jgi:hypothetical protein
MRIRRAEAQAAYLHNTSTSASSSINVQVDPCDAENFVDDEEAQNPICLRINTSVNITQSNNIVCLSDTPPAEHAIAIANAVVKAMQENSSGNCGIPMIDEDGRPRPIKIEVDASMLVEGSGNVVGRQSVINEFLRQRGLRRARQATVEDEEQDTTSPSKRRRVSIAE